MRRASSALDDERQVPGVAVGAFAVQSEGPNVRERRLAVLALLLAAGGAGHDRRVLRASVPLPEYTLAVDARPLSLRYANAAHPRPKLFHFALETLQLVH